MLPFIHQLRHSVSEEEQHIIDAVLKTSEGEDKDQMDVAISMMIMLCQIGCVPEVRNQRFQPEASKHSKTQCMHDSC